MNQDEIDKSFIRMGESMQNCRPSWEKTPAPTDPPPSALDQLFEEGPNLINRMSHEQVRDEKLWADAEAELATLRSRAAASERLRKDFADCLLYLRTIFHDAGLVETEEDKAKFEFFDAALSAADAQEQPR